MLVYLGYSDGCSACPGAGGMSGAGGGGQSGAGAGGQSGAGLGGGRGGGSGEAGGGGAAGEAPVDLGACEAPEPCGKITEQLGELTMPPDDASLRCVLQALRARTPGIYRRTTTIVTGIGPPSSSDVVYLVKADGAVHRQARTTAEVIDQICSSQPETAFDACLATEPNGDFAPRECSDLAWAVACEAGSVSCD
jgi:hypothetical protein